MITVSQLDEALYEFCQEIYPDQESVMCSIHEEFGGLEGSRHNCLGCNFADATAWIHNCLRNGLTTDQVSLEEFYFDYLLKLYLFVERVYVIFEIIVLPEEYRSRHFSVFKKVHKWANFIKHPKSFLLVHHARYFMDGDKGSEEIFDGAQFGVVIDQEFVIEYYGGPANNTKLHRLLTNRTDVAVLFPNVLTLTVDFCEAIHKFVSVIRDNAVYREILNSRSTYDDFFEKQNKETALP